MKKHISLIYSFLILTSPLIYSKGMKAEKCITSCDKCSSECQDCSSDCKICSNECRCITSSKACSLNMKNNKDVGCAQVEDKSLKIDNA